MCSEQLSAVKAMPPLTGSLRSRIVSISTIPTLVSPRHHESITKVSATSNVGIISARRCSERPRSACVVSISSDITHSSLPRIAIAQSPLSIVLLSISVSGNMAAPLRNLASMKVKDVPAHLKSSLSGDKVAKSTWSWLYKYNEKYIQTGSIRPLTDVMLAVGVLGYFVGWPTELRHLRHAEEAAKHGKDHH